MVMQEKIGFIGLGAMGLPMSRNLIKKGYKLTVYDKTLQRAKSLVSEGAQVAGSSKEVAGRSDVIIIMVPSSPQVREVILGKEGLQLEATTSA